MTKSADDRLPPRILSKIINHLPPLSLFTASQVNRRWSRIVKDLGALRLDFRACGPDATVSDYMDILKAQLQIVNCQGIHYVLVYSPRSLSSVVFDRLQALCPNVVYFDYYCTPPLDDPQRYPPLARKPHFFSPSPTSPNGWKHIRHLPSCHGDKGFQWIPYYADQLTTLHAHPTDFVKVTLVEKNYMLLTTPDLPYLTDLVLDIPHKLDERALHDIHQHCPRLTTLTLRRMQINCHYPNKEGSKSVLQSLTLDRITLSSFHNLLYLTYAYPELRRLIVRLDYQIVLSSAAKDPKQLNQIRIHWLNMIIRLHRLICLKVVLENWYFQDSPVLDVWPCTELIRWYKSTSKKKLTCFETRFGDMYVDLKCLLNPDPSGNLNIPWTKTNAALKTNDWPI
ncbi:uncharacterized protein BX664DRAFT_341843 [Halteromyces radiatus]|uniref:uncharacterized protein n=1 Tax=Halteromyces radiatus TaxID=101107 RepID=UPI002220DCFD|nr:uncharacterized protein BX664DRAFT_341843 [Halteromyces radiatus]KAI8079933.1 hypothetical protein BX664DRAFT_341843 [Halteromyces radiatus]